MRTKAPVIAAAALLLASAGIAVASADTPDTDPCDTARSDRDYMACRFDRLEKQIDQAQQPTDPATPTPSATPDPSDTPDPDPTPSASTTPEPEPTEDPTEPSGSEWPNADNTGVPAGVTLTTYTGPKTITTPTVIDRKKITGRLIVKAPLTIRNSELTGTIDGDYGQPVVIEDSVIDGGRSESPAVGYSDITLRRTEVKGARVSVLCGSDCLIEDSWLHGQYAPPGSDWHVNGYLSNGGHDVVVRHNTLACDVSGGACTGPAASFGDFAPLRDITYENNLFKAGPGGYCLHAGHNPGKEFGKDPTRVSVVGNVFERGPGGKCGYWGPATSFLQGNGNSWARNKFDDGTPVTP
jgi:hypothetical protein